jgi:class 3 adenylate cyclase
VNGPHVVTVVQPGRVPLHLLVRDRLPIGRAGDGLVLADERVSRRHCELRVRAGQLVVTDTGSSNGTLVNGTPVSGTQVLHDGDELQIGDTRIEVGSVEDAGPPPASIGSTVVGSLEPSVPTQEQSLLRASIVGTTLTLVFSDIVDSTVLVHRLGDQRWLEVLGRHDELTRRLVGRFRGTEVKGQGDGFLLTFPSARHALLFSIDLQKELDRTRAAEPAFPVHVRVGVHTGEVLHSSGDVFGRHVHRAARVAATAGSDEIVASALVRELAESMGDIAFGPAEHVVLKGFDGEQVVHEVLWRD